MFPAFAPLSEEMSRIRQMVRRSLLGFPGDLAVIENPPANAGDKGSIPDPGRSHMPRASNAVGHNYGAFAPEPRRCNY